MHAALPFPFFSNPFPRPAELRVDVDPSEDRGTPLAELYARQDPDLFVVCSHDPTLYERAKAGT